jgi:hypothetical protein
VARDQRVLTLALTLPRGVPADAAAVALKLSPKPAKTAQALRKAWLSA